MNRERQFADRILDALRYGSRPTTAGSGMTANHVATVVRVYADTHESMGKFSKPQLRALAREIEIEQFPELQKEQWICVAYALYYYEEHMKRADQIAAEKARRERNALLAEIGIEPDSQEAMGLTKPV